MNYEVRFLVGGEEHTAQIDATSAAEAAQIAQTESKQDYESEEPFELIQVQLLDVLEEVSHVQPGQTEQYPTG